MRGDTMNYKNYQQARDAAWKILLQEKIMELPVKITALCKNLGIRVVSYQKGWSVIRQLNLLQHADRTDGFTIYIKKTMIIFYDNQLSPKDADLP